VIQAMYFKEPAQGINNHMSLTPAFKSLLIITSVLIIILGIVPGLLIDWLYY